MSKIINDLKKLVSSSEAVRTGTVTEVRNFSIVVKSAVGIKEFFVASPTQFKAGSTVKFQGDIFIGSVTSDSSLPRYSV